MKFMRIGALGAVVALAGALGATPALADQCKQTCNTSYADCTTSGRDQTQCLVGWSQCKKSCAGPVKASVRTSTAPALKGGALQKAAVHH